MNGAESLLQTAVNSGIGVCFANPGTTELPIVTALDAVPGMRSVLGLFEGVCTGAADGYGRMARKPAMTLLHLGPGLANGIANLHNARRARTPIVNIIGDHATWHRNADSPLTSNIESLAAPVSDWVRTTREASSVPQDMADAVTQALRSPGHVVSLIVPADFLWEPSAEARGLTPAAEPPLADSQTLSAAADLLKRESPAALLLDGTALLAPGLAAAARIAARTNCALLCPTFPARIERGAGYPRVLRIPYFPDMAADLLASFRTIILAGAVPPVTFFGYPGKRSRLISEESSTLVLARPEDDVAGSLEALADHMGARHAGAVSQATMPPPAGPGAITPEVFGAAVASAQPERTIVVDEAATSGLAYYLISEHRMPFTHLTLTGGAIGQGMPCATGAAIACPDRKVLNLQADGSGMFTLQALWTQARERLNVVTVICSNRSYRILRIELARAGVGTIGRQADSLTNLSGPELDWVALATGMGVPAVRVSDGKTLQDTLSRVLTDAGPALIEAMMEP